MNLKRLAGVISALALIGCVRALDGPVGHSRYVFENQTSRAIELRFTPAPGSPAGARSVACSARAVCVLAEDGNFGVNPLPTDTFASISGYADVAGTQVEVLRQEPPVNERWTIDGRPAAFTPCCSDQEVRLTLTDADLSLP